MDASSLSQKRQTIVDGVGDGWPAFLGLLVLGIPTFVGLAREHWSTEAGAHAPIVIATGAWLIWRRMESFAGDGERGNFAVTLAALLPALVLYAFGRAFDYLVLESVALYAAAIATVYDRWGSRLLAHIWFPLFYLAFALPVPGWALDQATAPLKELASAVSTNVLQAFGIPIVREGVVLFVAQYQLLVEDACAGLNAIMGLTALGLLYVYLMHGSSWRYALLITGLFILPIAVAANIVRIIILVLLTLYGGNELAQGFLHGAAGLVMFATALGLVFCVDALLARLVLRRGTAA